jgi:hypothetical protein
LVRCFQGKTLVSKANLGTTKTPHINTGGVGDSLTHFSAYGLGWGLRDYRGVKIASHSGGIDGMLSQMWTLPELGLGVVVLTNGSPHNAGGPIVMDIVDRYLLGKPSRDHNALALEQRTRGIAAQTAATTRRDSARLRGTSPSLALAKYAGTYSDAMYGDVSVSVDGSRLVLGWQSFRQPLEHWHLATFRGTATQGSPLSTVMATFHLDARGQPSAIAIDGLATFKPL